MTDDALMQAVRDGDENAFGEIVDRYKDSLVNYLTHLVRSRDRAEEIAQDAFIQLLDHWGKVSSYEQPDAWVRRVAIRMAGRAARRERMRGLLEGRFRPVVATPPPDEPGNEVLRAVRSLPPNQRTAVVLFYFEDRPIAEIADVLGCSPATARVHLHKARQRLAALLHEEVDDVA